jgi:actin-related protein 10
MVNIHDISDENELYSALKELIQMLYFRYLAVNPKDRRVVMVESIFTRSSFRNQFVKVLFIHFDVRVFATKFLLNN